MDRLRRNARPLIPLQNLLAGPEHDAVVAANVVVDRFQIFDAVRLAADIGVNGERADFGALFALGIELVELVDDAALDRKSVV